jgi:hypothetical protein
MDGTSGSLSPVRQLVVQQTQPMKTVYTHTTKGVRYPYAQRVITLTSESGTMRLTTTQGELWKHEHDTFGGAGYYEQTYPVSTCWSYNKEKASQLTCNTLNKLMNQMDSPRTTNENHN